MMMSSVTKPRLGLIGATGRVGGWVLEGAIDRGLPARVLTRKEGKLRDYEEKVEVVVGNATSASDLKRLLYDERSGELLVDVVISTIGSPSKDVLVVEDAAKALLEAVAAHDNRPRIIWMTSTGINEATEQAKMYPGCGRPNKLCCGYGLFGWVQFKILIPYVISWDLWNDMAKSEDVIRSNEDVYASTVIVRPTNMSPPSEKEVFSQEWRDEGGANVKYCFAIAEDPPPGKWICRRAIAAALLDLTADNSKDGTAQSLFQG